MGGGSVHRYSEFAICYCCIWGSLRLAPNYEVKFELHHVCTKFNSSMKMRFNNYYMINDKADYALLARCIKLLDFLLLTAAKSTAALKYLVGAVEQ